MDKKSIKIWQQDNALAEFGISALFDAANGKTRYCLGENIFIELANLGDFEELALLHIKTHPGYFLTFLGKRFLGLFYRELLKYPGNVIVVCRREGKIIGFHCGAKEPRKFYRLLFRRKWFIFGLYSIPALVKKPNIITRLFNARKHSKAMPEHLNDIEGFQLGVDPEQSERGLAKKINLCFVLEAKKVGCERLSFTSDVGNVPANMLHKSCGFEIQSQYETREGRKMYKWSTNL